AKQYDGTIFHRVIPNFMVQGGGYNAKYEEKITRPPVPLEAQNGLKHEMGTIAMARTNDPNSARAQFFVNVKENPFLNAKGQSDGYTVFGRVVSGMDTINKIKAKVIAGAANNQLANETVHGQILKDRGILYAPDFLINAGGIINVYAEIVGYDSAEAMRRTENIYNTTLEIFSFSEQNHITTQAAAMSIAQQRIDDRKKENAAK
ncbi:peptidylprolyl isomerase, partial [Flavobacterium sp. BFFFF1]|uniref:peptidylprolyl isomerase n=1 Tax=Flavobacterium sp. BFFFF1 TaxID=2015557 RepID=UPI0025BC1295